MPLAGIWAGPWQRGAERAGKRIVTIFEHLHGVKRQIIESRHWDWTGFWFSRLAGSDSELVSLVVGRADAATAPALFLPENPVFPPFVKDLCISTPRQHNRRGGIIQAKWGFDPRIAPILRISGKEGLDNIRPPPHLWRTGVSRMARMKRGWLMTRLFWAPKAPPPVAAGNPPNAM